MMAQAGESKVKSKLTGMLSLMENESQLAFVLAHEGGRGNAKVYTKINALGVGTIQPLRVKKNELLTVLDLSMFAGHGSPDPAADYEANGIVTVGEGLDYIEKAIPKATEGRQHPSYRKSEVNPTLPLGLLNGD